ncbi:MAG: c-type cytochrome [Flavobacteriaceae bacterium]
MKTTLLFFFLSTIAFAQQSLEESYARGKLLYDDFCVRCHLSNGLGEAGLVPPLANADFLEDIKATVHSIKYGIRGPIIVNGVEYNGSMSPMGLEDDEIADVTNFILNSWGNTSDVMIEEQYVKKVSEVKL